MISSRPYNDSPVHHLSHPAYHDTAVPGANVVSRGRYLSSSSMRWGPIDQNAMFIIDKLNKPCDSDRGDVDTIQMGV